MKIVFMGTPDIAADALRQLLMDGHRIAAVFTREDKPVGRKQVLTAPPVKVLAEENRIPVYQPKTLRDGEAYDVLKEIEPDLIVVVAYGRILPADILGLPTMGCINMHVSLLPRYRGAAPVQWSVINGDAETGVTIMQMDEGLDTGPILTQKKITIGPEQTAGQVFDMVSVIGARLLSDTVKTFADGNPPQPQEQEGEVTLAPPLTKAMAEIDFGRTATEIANLVRGCNPWPLAWFVHEGKRVKLTYAQVKEGKGEPGEILSTHPLTVACGQNALELQHVVPEGSRPMTGSDWAAGRRFKAGEKL